MRFLRVSFVTAAIVAILAVAGAASTIAATAASNQPEAQPIFGTVGAIAANNFVVNTASSSVTVYFNVFHVKTTFTANSSTAKSQGFKTGDDVVASGTPAGHSIVAKTVIYDVVPISLNTDHTFAGQYVAHAKGTLTIGLPKTEVVVRVGTYTRYRENGRLTTKPRYARGDHVTAKTEEYSDSSWHATLVNIQAPHR